MKYFLFSNNIINNIILLFNFSSLYNVRYLNYLNHIFLVVTFFFQNLFTNYFKLIYILYIYKDKNVQYFLNYKNNKQYLGYEINSMIIFLINHFFYH